MKISRLRTAIATFALLFSGVFLFGVEEPTKYAFIVGVSKYADKKFDPLPGAVNDTYLFRDELIASCNFLKQNIVTLTWQEDDIERRPSKSNIEREYEAILGRLQDGDIFICMLSGHGCDINHKQIFFPEDASNDDIVSRSSTGISINDFIMVKLEKSNAKYKLVIVDACRNNTRFAVDRVGMSNIESLPYGVALLQSCSTGQFSFEHRESPGGAFVHFLLAGLRGSAASDGVVTLFDICKYTQRETQKYVREKHRHEQEPFFSLQSTDFIFRDDLLVNGVSHLKWNEAQASYQRAISYRRTDDYASALLEIKKSLSILPQWQDYLEAQAFIENSLAVKNRDLANSHAKSSKGHLATKDYAKAKTEIEKALKLFPGDIGYEEIKVSIEVAAKPPTVSQPTGSWVGSKAGVRKVLKVKGVDYAFRWCPAGTFTMGSPKGELGRETQFGGESESDETQHKVTLTQGFWMLETEVTQGMWESVMGSNPSYNKGARLPVANVSWGDCQEFMTKLNTLSVVSSSGLKFSMPTEAQWEYACRAGTTTALNSGKNLTDELYSCPNLNELGWYFDINDYEPHAVAQKKANAWGLFDMHGNVAEWCLDWYDSYASGAVTDPAGADSGAFRVNRGGSRSSLPWNCRSACRNADSPDDRDNDTPDDRYYDIGFRPCLIPLVPQF